MKLNNRGWGLQVMMIFVLILMICLVIVAALVNNNLGELVGNSSSSYEYKSLENKLNDAAEKYIKQNSININGKYTITVKKLQNEGYLSTFNDGKSNCIGYSVVEKKSNKLVYNAYIKCGSNYKTKNYSSILAE